MTQVGAGGIVMARMQRTTRFVRDYGKLTVEQQALADAKLCDLLANPRPPGLRFEKLKGYHRPDLYTIHVTGNYKISFAIDGDTAILRRVAPHDEIDRAP
ncbi:MAG TPA: hypothetical protein DCS21_07370 [Gammaproteobacteria bacterium]|nr:hypothetical protein [Gammaproteobacteria bacterium]